MFGQQFPEAQTHGAHALDGHAQRGKIAPENRGRRGDTLEDTKGREVGSVDGRVFFRVGEVFGVALHHLEIARLDAHVAAGEEAAAETIHRFRVGHEQGSAFVPARVAHDHRLRPPIRHLDHGGLVGHGPGQAQGVHHRVVVGGIDAHARASHTRTEGGVVDGDGPAQAGLPVMKKDDFLVTETRGEVEGPQFDHFVSQPRTSSYHRTEFSGLRTQ